MRRKYKHTYYVYSDEECFGIDRFAFRFGKGGSNVVVTTYLRIAERWIRRLFTAGCTNVTLVACHYQVSAKYPDGFKRKYAITPDKNEIGTGCSRIIDHRKQRAALEATK